MKKPYETLSILIGILALSACAHGTAQTARRENRNWLADDTLLSELGFVWWDKGPCGDMLATGLGEKLVADRRGTSEIVWLVPDLVDRHTVFLTRRDRKIEAVDVRCRHGAARVSTSSNQPESSLDYFPTTYTSLFIFLGKIYSVSACSAGQSSAICVSSAGGRLEPVWTRDVSVETDTTPWVAAEPLMQRKFIPLATEDGFVLLSFQPGQADSDVAIGVEVRDDGLSWSERPKPWTTHTTFNDYDIPCMTGFVKSITKNDNTDVVLFQQCDEVRNNIGISMQKISLIGERLVVSPKSWIPTTGTDSLLSELALGDGRAFIVPDGIWWVSVELIGDQYVMNLYFASSGEISKHQAFRNVPVQPPVRISVEQNSLRIGRVRYDPN